MPDIHLIQSKLYNQLQELERKMNYIEKRSSEHTKSLETELQHIISKNNSNTNMLSSINLSVQDQLNVIKSDLSVKISKETDGRKELETQLKQMILTEKQTIKNEIQTKCKNMNLIDGKIKSLIKSMNSLQTLITSNKDYLTNKVDKHVIKIQRDLDKLFTDIHCFKSDYKAYENELTQLLEQSKEKFSSAFIEEKIQRIEFQKEIENRLGLNKKSGSKDRR